VRVNDSEVAGETGCIQAQGFSDDVCLAGSS
jgi:hypothetical protein